MNSSAWTACSLALALVCGCARESLDQDWDSLLDASQPRADADSGSGAEVIDASAPLETSVTVDAGVVDAAPPDAADEPDAEEPVDAGVDAGESTDAAPRDAGADAATSDCVPGTYKGAFSGNVRLAGAILGDLLSIDISGTISINVETDSTGSLLVIKNGRVDGTDQDGKPVTAVVNGTMNCKTKQLVNGTLTDGVYKRNALTTVNFTGTVTAVYSPDPPSATGEWKTNDGFLEEGGGSWSAALEPDP